MTVTSAFEPLPDTLKNRLVAVGVGHRRADAPVYSVFEVL